MSGLNGKNFMIWVLATQRGMAAKELNDIYSIKHGIIETTKDTKGGERETRKSKIQ